MGGGESEIVSSNHFFWQISVNWLNFLSKKYYAVKYPLFLKKFTKIDLKNATFLHMI